jgi:transcriptional regulator with GAF, ATPase, and Fis domain
VQAKLLVISGLRESEFPVSNGLSIGSAPGCAICLEDPSVSAQHCEIREEGEQFVLKDLGSRGGTFVNGIPVSVRELSSGDELTVGNCVFLFQCEKTAQPRHGKVELDKGDEGHAHTQQLLYEELACLRPETLAALPQLSRMERNLGVLLRIGTALGSLQDSESLPWQLLGMVFDVIPAERGAIVLTEEDSQEIRSHVAWDRIQGPDHPVHVSQAVMQRVMEKRVSILEDAQDAKAEQGNPRSILCAPLVAGARALGILYLDTKNPDTRFTPEDLQLISAIAGLAALGIENARRIETLGLENQRLRAAVSLNHDMVGQSARMREVYQFIERVAPSDATVLIYGESGTGKELAARAIHKNSARKNQQFVALNCAALTETLLESELFGHEKGAFTSAVSQKKGFLEVAEGGTIFLDEIGELSPLLQAKLLRVLQEREFVRVGGTRPIKINVRFLAATNRDLQKAVREEKFRLDLFHRLNVISISLPALREHPEDIPALAEYFVGRHSTKCSRQVKGISERGHLCLMQYDWPGNIRELENAMERAVVVGSTEWIVPEDLPDAIVETGEPGETPSAAPAKYHEAIRSLKKQLILEALERVGGNVTEAAKVLGVHGNYLHRLMRNLDVRQGSKKPMRAQG